MTNTNAVDFFRQKESTESPSGRIILSIWDAGSPENIGRAIRLAHNVGAEKLFIVKDTVDFRTSKIKKTAGFSYEQMPWEFVPRVDFLEQIPEGFSFVALETCTGSTPLFQTRLPQNMLLLGGSESHGIPAEIIAQSQQQVYIPMPGGCKSMNITHALSVAAFEWYRQHLH